MKVIVIILIVLYFVPTIMAAVNKKKNGGAICALNIFLGWTFIGRVVALVWSLTKD